MTGTRRYVHSRVGRRALRRALIVAAIVGPILALINHGDAIVSGTVDFSGFCRIALTFLVPFCVSCVSSALAASDRGAGAGHLGGDSLSQLQIPHTFARKE